MLLDQSETQMCRFVCFIVVGTLTKIFLHCGPLTVGMTQINLHRPVATYVEYLQLGNCFVPQKTETSAQCPPHPGRE
jgi:hypothetical protein